MSIEVPLAAGYVTVLLAAALALEWLSVHTNNRSRQYRTAGFDYDEQHDFWLCHQGEQLWPEEFDREKRLVRYRAKPAVCRACVARDECTDDPAGREITRAVDPWPHSEAGRFHRGIAVLLVGVGLFIAVVALIRNHAPAELAVLLPLLAVTVFLGYWLGRDLLRTPSGFPEALPAHGNRLKETSEDEARPADPGGTVGEPALAPEGPSGLPPSRRREWWETEADPRSPHGRSPEDVPGFRSR
jgi:hypothetical protein